MRNYYFIKRFFTELLGNYRINNTPIPYVGPATEGDLLDLGFESLEQIAKSDPEDMYNRLCDLHGQTIDRCQLYVFRMVHYYAKGGRDNDLLKWWKWKDI